MNTWGSIREMSKHDCTSDSMISRQCVEAMCSYSASCRLEIFSYCATDFPACYFTDPSYKKCKTRWYNQFGSVEIKTSSGQPRTFNKNFILGMKPPKILLY